MSRASADGEYSALRGYEWQYDHAALRVYDSLVDHRFVSLRLVDRKAGKIDDLVLFRQDRTDFYQFRSSQHPAPMTFRAVVDAVNPSGTGGTTLMRDLGDCWKAHKDRHDNVQVHFVTNNYPSVSDALGDDDSAGKPSPDYFSAFVSGVLVPLQEEKIELEDVDSSWEPALERLRAASGVDDDDFCLFLRSLHMHFGVGSAIEEQPPRKRSDLEVLSSALMRAASKGSEVVKLDWDGVLRLVGWQDRLSLLSPHEFQVDVDTYAPLASAVDELDGLIGGHTSGYIAVAGSPGSGKSTLLTQALTGRQDRIVRYYAYVPDRPGSQTRLTAEGFLHDVVLMLARKGLRTSEHELPSEDINLLRRQFAELLDRAGDDFREDGRRTIIVVDGLDHVERDRPGSDGMLLELPGPGELPNGVMFIVGSRSTVFLKPQIRSQLDQREAEVDLAEYPLSPLSVMEICSRPPVAAHFGLAVHERVAELCGGHPLALRYLLNRLQDEGIDSDESALAALADVPPFDGDIEVLYQAVWDSLTGIGGVADLFSVCSRLRIGFTTEWLHSWADREAIRTFQTRLRNLFVARQDGWHFFHDSFRQFAANQSAPSDPTLPPELADQIAHKRAVEVVAASCIPSFAAEELYHEYRAGHYDRVMQLADQTAFRKQFLSLRSPNLIREDIVIAMEVAADRGDIQAMIRLFLALFEATERAIALENVDFPGLLLDVGLVDEAIAYCADGAKHVPLAHIYGLAAKLERAGNPEGRRLFCLVEHHGPDDPDQTRRNNSSDYAPKEWAAAAVLFRPAKKVIESIQAFLDASPGEGSLHPRTDQLERWHRYRQMMQALVESATESGDAPALVKIDKALEEHTTQLRESEPCLDEDPYGQRLGDRIDEIMDLRSRAVEALLELDDQQARSRIERLSFAPTDAPLHRWTLLSLAWLFYRCGNNEQAAEMLDCSPYDNALDESDLSDPASTGDVYSRFEYWWLRHQLAPHGSSEPQASAPTPTAARAEPVAQPQQTMGLASIVDSAVRTLARLAATPSTGQSASDGSAWNEILPLLRLLQASHSQSGMPLSNRAFLKSELLEMVVVAVCKFAGALPQRLSDQLRGLFQNQPDEWPKKLQVELAERLRNAGASAPWRENALGEWEKAIANEDVYQRLSNAEELSRLHAEYGDLGNAKRLALGMIPMALGVGYRKDHQFDFWVDWLARALAEPGGHVLIDDAAWMARLLTASDPMTEGAPGRAASDLPAAVVPASPSAAVRIFEYLVRHGTVSHLDALAPLVGALAEHSETDKVGATELAVDTIAELIAPAASRAYPTLTASLLEAAKVASNSSQAEELARSVASRTDNRALVETRNEWRQGLGLPIKPEWAGDSEPQDEERYGSLKLADGQQITLSGVAERAKSADDIIKLHSQQAEHSYFSWDELIDKLVLSDEDVRMLGSAFDDGSATSHEVLASLAEAAERNGDAGTAKNLAERVLECSIGESWSRLRRGASRRAAAVTIRLGGEEARLAACRHLARQVAGNRWLIGLLIPEFDKIAGTLDPQLKAEAVWPEIREHLNGHTESLDLPDPDVLGDHGCRWWLPEPASDHREAGSDPSSEAALAELVVGHLSHPTWLIRDAAAAVSSRAIGAGNHRVADALSKFAGPDTCDDLLEAAGRCLAAARTRNGHTPSDSLQQLEEILADHPSWVLRELASDRTPRQFRPLPLTYSLDYTPPTALPDSPDTVLLFWHQQQLETLANNVNLNLHALLRIVWQYALSTLKSLPSTQQTREALDSSGLQLAYPSELIAASRAGLGRVIADLADARLLGELPLEASRYLRTIDIDLLTRAPEDRPSVIPTPPPVGYEQTTSRWLEDTNIRLDKYAAAAENGEGLLIGAKGKLTVLNWDRLQEHFICGTTVGEGQPAEDGILACTESMILSDLASPQLAAQPQLGEPLVVQNGGQAFHQTGADWLAFRPDIATVLSWVPDSDKPGNWHTATGRLAVCSTWWVDGMPERLTPNLRSTAAEGHTVTLTQAGLADIEAAFGTTTRHIHLRRTSRQISAQTRTARAHQPLHNPNSG